MYNRLNKSHPLPWAPIKLIKFCNIGNGHSNLRRRCRWHNYFEGRSRRIQSTKLKIIKKISFAMIQVSKLPIPIKTNSNYLKQEGNHHHENSSGPTPATKTWPIPFLDSSEFMSQYKASLDQSDQFWDAKAKELIHWNRDYSTVYQGNFQSGNSVWFKDGGLNAAYNCLDRWASKFPNRTAIIWVAEDDRDSLELSYQEVFEQVCKLSNLLKSFGVKKGDTVAIYLPMIPAAVISFLACARIGAIHSVVFAGFSAESLRDRILDARAKVVLTADEGKRGGKTIGIKKIVDEALDLINDHDIAKNVLVYPRTGSKVNMKQGRDIPWIEACSLQKSFCPIEIMDSEDPLFILYTSGSTGKPKGLVHTTAGYLLGAALTVKYVFDVHEGDRFACMADVGWITGHTYIVYGPLMNGVSTTVFESTPIYPTPSRYWETVAKYRLTQFYTAPTAIRLLQKLGTNHVDGHDLSSLRTIGSVGEPINPEAWKWYDDHVGKNECAVVDTYWQTETGSIIISPLPGATEAKPGSATLPFFGIDVGILEPTTGKEIQATGEGVLVIKRPWPSMARTIFGDHQRFIETYFKPYPGYYFTGDGAERDSDGYYWIKGRVDDVLNVSGHRLSTAEIESAIAQHPWVGENAVVGAPDETTGQTIHAFVILKAERKSIEMTNGTKANENDMSQLKTSIINQVRKAIGPFAHPKKIMIVNDLPKTRSGKIMRRILRKIASGDLDDFGDLSTLSNPQIVHEIILQEQEQ
ncbi:hypothetical protein O181_064793 [Austropuccinia psidii MF-1]|uniref:Acetyl-coenzyme A synthetase n=1 Tax=Austropuccinia psidii MF-1 TaxID=1389203 RepID=A0A9Q3ENL7_9BASI|nr:hypothetical protein [Austropuccinia psidii MF-1]